MVRLIVVALVLLLAIGGGYWYWTTTPQYSLDQLKESVSEHNLSKFQLYFDVDSVSQSMVKDLLASPLRKVLGGEFLARILSSGMVSENTVVYEVASSIAGDIKMLVRTGKFNEEDSGGAGKVSLGSLDKRLGIRTLSVKEVKEVKVNGDTATVTLLLHNQKFDTDLTLRGELRSKDGYWQAARFTNIADCFQKLFELEGKSTKPVQAQ